jgi:uncharacterized membrane protein YhaH (DUF805 family)
VGQLVASDMKWITKCFKNYAVFNGRAGRNECTYFFLFVTFVQVLFLSIDLWINWELPNIYGLLFSIDWVDGIPWYPLFEISRLLTALPAFAVGVRRLHDLNKSGWLILLIFTGIGIIPIVYWCCFLNGDEDDNQYGLRPTQ